MKVEVIGEIGYHQALLGVGLSYGKTSDLSFSDFLDERGSDVYDDLVSVAARNCKQDGGHNGFLEFMDVYLDIDAPNLWWNQWDTYDIGVRQFKDGSEIIVEFDKVESSRLSESTMHTLKKRNLTENDFEYPILYQSLDYVNKLIKQDAPIQVIKGNLPEGFLVRRIIKTNYKAIRNIMLQRRFHKIPLWKFLIQELLKQVKYPELLPEVNYESK